MQQGWSYLNFASLTVIADMADRTWPLLHFEQPAAVGKIRSDDNATMRDYMYTPADINFYSRPPAVTLRHAAPLHRCTVAPPGCRSYRPTYSRLSVTIATHPAAPAARYWLSLIDAAAAAATAAGLGAESVGTCRTRCSRAGFLSSRRRRPVNKQASHCCCCCCYCCQVMSQALNAVPACSVFLRLLQTPAAEYDSRMFHELVYGLILRSILVAVLNLALGHSLRCSASCNIICFAVSTKITANVSRVRHLQ